MPAVSRRVRVFALAGAAVLLLACGGPKEPATTPAPAQPIESMAFAPALGIDLSKFTKTRSGGYYQDLLPGTGATAGLERQVTVRYVVYLTNGTAIQVQDAPMHFTLGPDVIRGWREGIPGMRVGGIRKLILPPALAYGKTKHEVIPPNSTLVFEIELLSVK